MWWTATTPRPSASSSNAGSTGSRVHIYQHGRSATFNTLPPPLSLPLTSERWTERIKPGLSDYNDDAERAADASPPDAGVACVGSVRIVASHAIPQFTLDGVAVAMHRRNTLVDLHTG